MANGQQGFGLGLADLLRGTSTTAPNILQRLGQVLQGKADPLGEHENRDLIRKIQLGQLMQGQQRLGMEQRQISIQERQAALKDIDSFNSILKVSKEFIQFILPEQRDKLAETLATSATNAKHPFADSAMIRAYLEKPDEGITALNAVREGITSGKASQGFANALTLTRDPELRKALIEGIIKLEDKTSQGNTLSGIGARVVKDLATNPITGELDAEKAIEVHQRWQTNPQGAESRIFGYLTQKHKTGKPDPAMEAAIKEYQSTLFGTAGARAGGAVTGQAGARGTVAVQEAEKAFAREKAIGTEQAQATAQLTELAQASAIVDELDALSKRLITAKTDIESVPQRLKLSGQALAFSSSLPGLYDTRKKNLAEALARNIGGVKGTATEGDIERMVAGVPGFGDTIKSRNYRIAAIRAIVGTAIENKRRFIQGESIDLEKSRQQFKEMVDSLLTEEPSTGRFKEIK